MASFCYVCGTATPAGLNRDTGEVIITTMRSGIGPADLLRKLQRALGPGYELQERIGAGGFAEVFRARDLRLKRDLAVKVLRPDLGLSPELLQRFRREAETIATLRNPHIVPVYDIGEAEGLAFIIMPLITGESLRAVLDHGGPMAPDEARRILREAAQGLAAAHDAGVIHRDIKPENIMLEGRDKRVLLMDFGIAKAVGAVSDGDPGATLTTTGIIIGTPQYMSPEQACGDKTIDARSDQYSLGVVGYRMLAGGLPFEGDSTRAVLYQQLVAEPTPLASKVPGVPGGLANAIQRAMSKEPADRYANMTEFAAALSADAAPIAAPSPTRRPATTRKWVIGGVVGLAAIAVAAVALRPRTVAPPTPAGRDSVPSIASVPPAPPPPDTIRASAPAANTPKSSPPKTPPTKGHGTGPQRASTAAASTAAPPPSPPAPAPVTATCARFAAAANWSAAAQACPKEAAAGNAAAERILGTMYDKGNGVAENPTEAVNWYRRAATDAEAQFLLSRLEEIGRGTQRDDAESVALLRVSAAGGFLLAQQTLAWRLATGTGIHKDETEAAVWYRRAAERGDVVSEMKLAEMLEKGHGVDKDEAQALTWYRRAGDNGAADGAWQASQMYFKGHGAAKSDSMGMIWLRKAAQLKQPDAVKELAKRTGST